MKQAGGYEKGLLRYALEGLLPDEVLYRNKSPYPKTFQPKYTELVISMMNDVLKDTQSPIFEFVSKEQLTKLVETEGKAYSKPWYGQLMTGPQLLAHLWQVNYWLNHYDVRVTS